MRVVNLRRERAFVEQYIRLRDSYADLLLTSPVSREETEKWLWRDDIEVRGLEEDGVLQGVAVLYLHREGEIAFFARERDRGIGTRLLAVIEETARERGIPAVRAWTLKENTAAQRVFEKCGFSREGTRVREYKGEAREGVSFRKELSVPDGGSGE